MGIELTKLEFEVEPDHDEDKVSIFTRMGIHRPGVPMGHKCMVAKVYCGDTTDPDDSAYQIAQLFISAPQLLGICKELMELADNGSASFDDPEEGSVYLRAQALFVKLGEKAQE